MCMNIEIASVIFEICIVLSRRLLLARDYSWPYTTAAESSRAASHQRTWTVYTYWPVSPLLTSGGLLPAAWNAHDKRQTPDINYSVTNQLLNPLDSSVSSSRLRLWKDSRTDLSASVKMGLEVTESLPAGPG